MQTDSNSQFDICIVPVNSRFLSGVGSIYTVCALFNPRRRHEGNTEEENSVYVVFKWNIYGSAWKSIVVRGKGVTFVPTTFCSRLLDRYLKTTWTVLPPTRIFASWQEEASKHYTVVEFRCPVQISDCSSLNQLLEFTQRLFEGGGGGGGKNYFFTVRDFQTYKK